MLKIRIAFVSQCRSGPIGLIGEISQSKRLSERAHDKIDIWMFRLEVCFDPLEE